MILHSNIIGTGFPLVILHGYFGMGDNWRSHAMKLSEDFQVHVIDQRNHGRSFHSESFNYDLLAADLRAYFKAHQIEKAHVLGHSMGGKTAMLFAGKHPELVEKLIIADIGPKAYPPHHDIILKTLNAVDFNQVKLRSEVDDIYKNYIKDVGVRQFLLKNIYRKTKDELAYRFNLKSLTDHNPEVGAALPENINYDGEVLFLKGEKSKYIVEEDFDLIRQHFPKAIVSQIDKAGHWLHAENPIQFYQKLMDFIKK